MMPDINEHLTEIARKIADEKIAELEKYSLEVDIKFSFGNYYARYRLNSDSAYWLEDVVVITVSLKEVLKTIMESEE